MNTISKSQLGRNARDAAPDNNASSGLCAVELKMSSDGSCPDFEAARSTGQPSAAEKLNRQDSDSVQQNPALAPTNAEPCPEQQGAIQNQTVATDGNEKGSDGAERDYHSKLLLRLLLASVRKFRKAHGSEQAPELLRDLLWHDAMLENDERRLREEKV